MKETLEEAAERLQKDKYGIFISKDADVKGQLVIDTGKAAFSSGMNEGAKWQQERMYSEFDLDTEITKLNTPDRYNNIKQRYDYSESDIINLFEQFKKK